MSIFTLEKRLLGPVIGKTALLESLMKDLEFGRIQEEFYRRMEGGYILGEKDLTSIFFEAKTRF